MNTFPVSRCNYLSRFKFPDKPRGPIRQADSSLLMIAFMVLFPLGVRVTCLVASLHVILFVPAIVSAWGGVSTHSYNTSYIPKGPVIVSIARTSN